MQTIRRSRRRIHNVHGAMLISVLAIVVVISLVLAGSMALTVTYFGRVHIEADYAAALDTAEAGVNYELRKISQDATTADQAGTTTPPGTSYNFGNGAFCVYCTNRDGSTPWMPGTPLYIYSIGTVQGVSRTIRVATKYVNNAVTWNITSATGDLVGPQVFTGTGISTVSITARGYNATNAPSLNSWNTGTVSSVDLYGKVSPGDPTETGLGLSNNPSEYEINGNSFIQLDMKNVEAASLANVSLTIGSIQLGEGYSLWGSNSRGAPGTLLQSYTNLLGLSNVATFTIPNLSVLFHQREQRQRSHR
jgi:Tfp pilus assembly protein PilX